MRILTALTVISVCAGGNAWLAKPVVSRIPLELSNPSLNADNGINLRIINGTAAKVNQFPWFVSVRSYTKRGLQSICGGSLISKVWVLTAAHCTHDFETFNLGLGSRNLNKPFISLTSQKVIQHQRYNSTNLNNDIALIELPKPMVFTTYVQAIRLPTLKQSVSGRYFSDHARVCGFGRTSDVQAAVSTQSMSPKLNWVDKRIISNDLCARTFGSEVVIPSTLCGIGWEYERQSTCTGDSGGPLVIDEGGVWTQIGIVSFISNKGCSFGHPSGYVRATSFLNWISINTGITIRV